MSKILDETKPWHVIVLIVVVILVYAWSTMSRHDDDHTPTNDEVVDAAHTAIQRFALEFAAQRRAMAKALNNGDIDTDDDYSRWFDDHLDEGFENSLGELAELEQEVIGRVSQDDEFNTRDAAAFCRDIAEGYERAAKELTP